jgi:peptidyl-prolyl cis-trans isomerase SurA
MKRLFLFTLLACITTCVFSQTLFTYGTNAVDKTEFLRAYNKNKTAVTDKAMALREYLDLYIKFKLKVKAAKEMHIDTLATLTNDLQNFRTQIEESYLNDESQVSALTQQAFDRSQKDIHVAYWFFPFKDFKDSAAIEGFHARANQIWNDLGFITVFSLPYEMENIVYNLKIGEESKIFRGKNGYYIFKNIEERKAVGKIKAAQILIALPEGAKDADKIAARKLADSIYRAIQAGSDFGELAKQFSNDKMTYISGGIMPEFGVGKYDPQFENKIFAIQKDGEVIPPLETKFGYHIIKRISKSEIPQDKTNDSYLFSLKQQVLQDSRIFAAKEKFVKDILKKLNYKKSPAVKEIQLWTLTDSSIVANKKNTSPNLNTNTILFSLNNQIFKVSDWIAFVKNYKATSSNYGETDSVLMQKFISKTALDNYKKRLPDFNPEFKYHLQEFKDGNMLFEVMERNVWTKASNDSAGLKNYYQQHKTKYTWNESADAVLISSSNEKTATDIAAQIKKGKSWKQVAEENVSQVQTDSGRYDLTQIPAKPNTKFVEGMITEPLVNENDGTATFVKILKLYPANQQRNFDEARGLVINDYQIFLEEKWIEQLKMKYPVKVNEKVFQSLL